MIFLGRDGSSTQEPSCPREVEATEIVDLSSAEVESVGPAAVAVVFDIVVCPTEV